MTKPISEWKILQDNVLLKDAEVSETTPGGIIYAPSVADSELIRVGQILKIGVGNVESEHTQNTLELLSEGQLILFDIRKTVLFDHGNEKLRIIRMQDIMALL